MQDRLSFGRHCLSDFTPDKRNANKGTDKGRAALTASLKNVGAGRSIVVDKHGNIIAGNKTMEVAKQIGIQEVIVVPSDGTKLVAVQRTDLDLESDAIAKELAIADNRVQELNLEWDLEVLQQIQQEVDLSEYWDEAELNALIEGLEQQEHPIGKAKNKEQQEEVEIVPRCQPGEIWQLGKHRLLCGDSTDSELVGKLLAGQLPNFIWADPPYGIKIQNKDGKIGDRGRHYPVIAGDEDTTTAINSFKFCQQFASATQIWWGANNYSFALPGSSCWIVWDKKTEKGDFEGINFADAELAYVNKPLAVRVFRHLWLGAWRESEVGRRRVHPTQKPIELAVWAFDKYGSASDLIFDPFFGSGISVLAAEQMQSDRTVCAAELMPYYCEIAMRRWEEEMGEKAKRSN